MKLVLIFILSFTTLNALGTDFELSYDDHCETKLVVMDSALIEELIRIVPAFDINERMIAGSRESKDKKKVSWQDDLRLKIQGSGNFSRL